MTTALGRGEGTASRPGRSLPLKTRYTLYRLAGWAPGPVWTGMENLTPPGFDSRTVQPVDSRYTDWATRPMTMKEQKWHGLIFIFIIYFTYSFLLLFILYILFCLCRCHVSPVYLPSITELVNFVFFSCYEPFGSWLSRLINKNWL
jgi:hypothetical protein